MTQTTSSIDIMTIGMDYLVEKMGIVAAETFIATIQREKFDYTKWHQNSFANDMTCAEFLDAAAEYERTNLS